MLGRKEETTLQFRHEVKHEISYTDMLVLRQRLQAVMQPDPYAVKGCYEIRSLYFDNIDDKALLEKINGMSIREKYRIRMYNHNTSVIHLERKYKQGNLGYKDTALLTVKQVQAILNNEFDWMAESENNVILGFYTRIRKEGLRPKVIVDYSREPFIFAPGNVRVTLDYNIRTALWCTDFLNPNCVTIPVPEAPYLLEVKWDQFLPDVVRDAVQLEHRHNCAYSKYAASRMYD